MAEALVSVGPYLIYLLKQLDSIIGREIEIGFRFKREIEQVLVEEKLRETLTNLQSQLQDAEEILSSADKSVTIFLEKLKDVAYDMEDFLDEWRTEIFKSSSSQKRQYLKDVCSISCLISYLISGVKPLAQMQRGKRVEGIKKKLDSLKIESSKLDLTELEIVKRIQELPSPPGKNFPVTTTADYDVDDDDNYEGQSNVGVLGRDSDKDILVKKLVKGDNSTGGLHVLPIVGMGGVGKTTLAKHVFNDEEVKTHFEMRIWVSVSQTSDQERILRKIVKAAAGTAEFVDKDDDNNDVFIGTDDDLLHLLSDRVKGKKFLLVLDDVWDEDIRNWQELKHSLKSGAEGSSVLVTTRNKMVAYLMSTTYLHHLGKLSDEDSWCLFRRIALMGRDDDDEDELKVLEDIGRKLVKICYGHPLAVKVLAGLMRYKRTRQEWLYVMESDEWEQLEMEPTLPPLQFAYYSLPSHLKQCFTYTSIFPEDQNINKDMLIKCWMAQGFLESTKIIDMEMIGEEYFQNLLMRSFLQGVKKDKDGKVTHCKVHDLLRNLALPISRSSIVGIGKTELISSKVRHLLISNRDFVSVLPSLRNLSKLRTLKLSKCKLSPPLVSPHLFTHFKSLRALDLNFSDFEKLPSEIGQLRHLRYLDLCSTKLKCLPETLCNLYNLQTLRLKHCHRLSKLPKGMRKLINLRHLEIQDTPKLCYLPHGIGRLGSLQTLSKFIVSAAKGECKIGELTPLHKLRGNLCIEGLGRVENLAEANEAWLKNKEYLRDLTLDFRPYELENVREGEVRKMETLLDGLQPNPKLEKLAIHHGHVPKFPSWMVSDSTLSNLRTLIINDCQELEQLPALGKLPSLQELCIQKLDGVKHIGNEFYGIGSGAGVKIAFQVLEELRVVDMANLEQWDFIVQDEKIMPRLRELSLQVCPKLMSVPHIFPGTLKNLRVSGCPKLPSSAFEKLNLQGDTGVLPRPPFEKSPFRHS